MDRQPKDPRDDYRENLASAARRFPRRVADSLASQSALLIALMDSVDELVLVLDPSLRIVKANRYASISLSYAERRLLARPLSDFLEEGDRPRFSALAESALAESALRSRASGEFALVTRALGALRLAFTICPLRGASGEPHGLLAVAKSLPDPSEVPESSGLSERMLHGFANPLFLLDGFTRSILECNDAAESAAGLPRASLLGRRLFDFGSCGDGVDPGESIMARADEAYAQAGVFVERVRYPDADGRCMPYDCIAIPLLDRGGRPRRIIVMLFDRSADEDREAELVDLIRRVSDLSAQLGELASSYSPRAEAPTLSSLGFTRRQVEIALLVAEGASSKDIGFRLGIAESTVKNHLAVMYQKLGVGSRMGFMREVADRHIKLR